MTKEIIFKTLRKNKAIILVFSLLIIFCASNLLMHEQMVAEISATRQFNTPSETKPITIINNYISMQKISQYLLTPDSALSLAIKDDFAYLLGSDNTLRIISFENKSEPVKIGEYDATDPRAFIVDGDFIYLTDIDGGLENLEIINVSDKTQPELVSSFGDTMGTGADVAITSTEIICMADGSDGLELINVSDKNTPELLGIYEEPLTGDALAIDVQGEFAYVGYESGDFIIINISDATNPIKISQINAGDGILNVKIIDNTAFLAHSLNTLSVIDISNKNSPQKISEYSFSDRAFGLSAIDGGVLSIANGNNGIALFNITDLSNFEKIGDFFDGGSARDIVYDSHCLFIADYTDGLEILGIDADNDSLLDYLEVGTYHTDPNNPDSDGDGLLDGMEINIGTNPLKADTDSDTMDDYWEVSFGTDPLSPDADEDPDLDGLTNLQEYIIGTNPLNRDTDGDTIPDGEEYNKGYDPLDPNDYPPQNGKLLWWLLPIISVIVIILITLIVFTTRKKRIIKEPFLEKTKIEEDLLMESSMGNDLPSQKSINKNLEGKLEKWREVFQPSLKAISNKVEEPVDFVSSLLLLRTILIIDKNGIPLYSINFDQEIDATLTAGFLTAISNFNAEMISQKQTIKSKFSQIGQEGGIFWIFEGKSVQLALLLKSRASNVFKKAVWRFLNEFETKYAKTLEEFSGAISDFEDTIELLQERLCIYYLAKMEIVDKQLQNREFAQLAVKRVLEYYLENFEVGHLVSIHELIDQSFKILRTSTFEEILLELIILVENGVLLPKMEELHQKEKENNLT